MPNRSSPKIVRLTDQIEGPFNAYVIAVGRVAHHWNHLQEALAQLFHHVLKAQGSGAFKIWYSIESDRLQQKLLTEIIRASPDDRWPKYPGAKEALLWLVKEASNLGDMRNDAIHVPCAVAIDEGKFVILPIDFRGHPRATKLITKDKDILQECDVCERYAAALTQYATDLWSCLEFHPAPGGGLLPLPQEPSKPDRKPKSQAQKPADRHT